MKKLLMSSIVLTTFAIAIAIFQVSSCKKADAQPTTAKNYPIEGLWIGTYTVDGEPGLGDQYFSFVIKPGGTIINDTKGGGVQHLGVGTWALNGTILTCSFTCVYGISSNIGITETSTATWDKAGKLTAGIWKNIPPLNGSGTITLTRVN